MAERAKRKLGIYSLGILRNKPLCQALDMLGWTVRPGPITADLDAIGIWGASPAAERGRAAAKRRGLPIIHLEDAPLRSVTASRKEPLMGFFLDRQGNHLDVSAKSDLEALLNRPTGVPDAEVQIALEAFLGSGLSKYNDSTRHADALPGAPFVLVIDQLVGDASIALGGAAPSTFDAMLAAAIAENPGVPIYVKRHPRAVKDPALGHFRELPANAKFLEDGFAISDVLDRAKAVYTVTSQVGFEAILRGIRPRVFGGAFYAGWGLSLDEMEIERRTAQHTPQSIFQRVMMEHAVWIDPYHGGLTDVLSAMRGLEARKRSHLIRAKGAVALGMKPWKRSFLGNFLGSVRYASSAQRAVALATNNDLPLVVWASSPELKAVPESAQYLRMEDGFLRSVGLGAALRVPQSLVLDDLGIYYDPSRESRLEHLIRASKALPQLELERAENVCATICDLGLSKYNVGTASGLSKPNGRLTILVPGQVEDDASILRGTGEISTNRVLLEAVRAAHPEAYIFYKPHPDVEAALRTGGLTAEDARKWADDVLLGASADAALSVADEVHTMTSLMGFEALMRGKRVITYGQPFYAGWGLTHDQGPKIARREDGVSLAGLVHAALIGYPLYVDPVSGLACPVETIVARLAEAREFEPTPFSGLLRAMAGMRRRLPF